MSADREAHKISYSEWLETYKPVIDRFDEPKRYETYGKDLEFVKKKEDYVWTVVDLPDEEDEDYDVDDDDIERIPVDPCWVIIPGIHLVNRLFFHVCKEPHHDADIEVGY